MNVFIDIETIPDQTPGAVELIAESLTVKAPDLTKPKLIEALGLGDQGKFKTVQELKECWIEEFGKSAKLEQAEAKWLKTSFDGGYGHIICIGINTDVNTSDKSSSSYTTDPEDGEVRLLRSFWDWINDVCDKVTPFFIAHNAKFDLPFLYKRSVILGVEPNKYFKPFGRHDQNYYCTMEAWTGFGGKISLDRLAGMLGLEGKSEGICGADVWPEYQKGNIKKIAEYCEQDVTVLKNIYNRLTFA